MRFNSSKKFTSLLLGSMLIVAMAFTTSGCVTNNPADSSQLTTEVQATETQTTEAQTTVSDTAKVLGEGETMFPFSVVDLNGNETSFEIHTDKETVGDALLDLKLIDGENGQYGLYVKSVNGITADYDIDKTYWAFYINGEYAMTGVDSTRIEDGVKYSFKVEKQ